MNSISGLALVLALVCAIFLTIVGIYITWFVPIKIVRLLTELRDESRTQTALLRQLLASYRASNPPSEPEPASPTLTLGDIQRQFDHGEISEAQYTRRKQALLEAGPKRIPGIN